MKNRTILMGIITVFIFTIALSAQPWRRPHQGKEQMRGLLDLSEEQQEKMTDMRLKMKKEILPLQSEIAQLRSHIRLELTAEKFDESKVSKLNEKVSQLHQQIQMKRILHRRQVRDILTPEQQKNYDLHLLSRGKEAWSGPHRSPAMHGPRPPKPQE